MLETLLKPDDKHERCGLILADGTLVEIENIAEDTRNAFFMNPEEVLPHLLTGKVVGTWHTHPHTDPSLSGDDYVGFSGWPQLKHHIIGYRNKKIVVEAYEMRNGVLIKCV